MSNLNLVVLQGNLTDVPKLVGKDKNVARFTIAVNSGFGDRKETAFVDCVAFGKQAEIVAAHLTKGKQIIVKGQIVQNRWTDKDDENKKHSKLEVRLNQFDGFFFTGNGNGATNGTTDVQEETPAVASNAEAADGKLF